MKFLLGLIMFSSFAFSQEVPPSVPTVFYDFTDSNFPPNVTTIKEASAIRVVAGVLECIPVTPTPGFFFNIPGPTGSSQFTEYIPATTCSGVRSKGATSLNIVGLGDQSNNLENRNQIYKVGFEILVPEAVIPWLTFHANDTGATARGPAPSSTDLSTILLSLREISRTEPPTPTVCTTAAGIISLTKASETTYEGAVSSQVTANPGKYPLSVECNRPIQAVFINIPSGSVRVYSIDGSRTISNIPNPTLITSLSIYATPDQDIRIDQFRIGQTVFDPDFIPEGAIGDREAPDGIVDNVIDLVRGKSALAVIEGTASSGITSVPVAIIIDGLTSPIQMASVDNSGKFQAKISIPTASLGSHSIQAVLDPNQTMTQSNRTNDFSQEKQYQILNTYPLAIGVTAVTSCTGSTSCYSGVSPSEFAPFTNATQAQFLTDIFPVASDQLTLQQTANTIGSNDNSPGLSGTSRGVLADAQNLYLQAIVNNKRKMVGVYDPSYARYHSSQPGAVNLITSSGFRPRGFPVAMVQSNDPSAMAHELSHALGQGLEYYEHPTGFAFDGTGINARTEQILSDRTAIMDDVESAPLEQYWIEKNTYLKVFNTLLKPDVDPAIVVVTGFIAQSGQVSEVNTALYPSGLLTNSDNNGTLVIKTLNSAGQMLSQSKIIPDFNFDIDRKSGPSETIVLNEVPFVFSLPDSASVASVQIERNGTVLLKKTVVRALPKAIDLAARIPLLAINEKTEIRKALVKAALVIEGGVCDQLIKQKKQSASIVALKLFRGTVVAKVKASYPVKGNELTREQVLQQIDSLISSLR